MAAAALVAVLLSWWGAGGTSLRRGSRSLVRGLAPSGVGAVGVTAVLLATSAYVVYRSQSGAGALDLGARAGSPLQQACVHQPPGGLPDGRSAEAVAPGDLDLGLDPLARLDLAVLNGVLELLGELEVERNRTPAIQHRFEGHARRIGGGTGIGQMYVHPV